MSVRHGYSVAPDKSVWSSNDEWIVVYDRVFRRAEPSKEACIVGMEKQGAKIVGRVVEVDGIRWVKTKDKRSDSHNFMMIHGASVGLGTLLECAPSVDSVRPVGSIGESLWEAPLDELPRPKWAPRIGFASLCAGKASTGCRMLWVLGSECGSCMTNEIWRSIDGGASWNLFEAGKHWSARMRMGATVGSTLPEPKSSVTEVVKGIVYIVGGRGASGFKADVWASDTMCRSWHCMNTHAPFGPRADVACAVVPGHPLTLVVAGGVSSDLHRDVWLSLDAGEKFIPVDIPGLPRSLSLRLWPPGIICAARAGDSSQLALWKLTIGRKGGQDVWNSQATDYIANLDPVNDFAEDFVPLSYENSLPIPPKLALDLQAQVVLGWDRRRSCLTVQSLACHDEDTNALTHIVDVVADAGDAHVLCDMDSVFASLRHGFLWVISEDGSRAWVSGRARVSAQDRFLRLLGLHLHLTWGIPMELWLGRIRLLLLPRRSARLTR